MRLKKDGTYARLPQPTLPKPKERITFTKASRTFSARQRRQIAGHARGRCEGCGTTLETGWHGHHKTPYSLGGKTDVLNAEALCVACHRERHRPDPETNFYQHEPDASSPVVTAPEPVEPEAGARTPTLG
jgi:5-methylcytosine-specific restriction endonuclease McrA